MICSLKNTNWEKIKVGVEKYLWIMETVKKVNVQKNKEFQRKFNGFYRIRQRSELFYKVLYFYLEKNKNKKISFEETLDFLLKKTNHFEPSFSSKIMATVNPVFPIWDSEVLKRLELSRPNDNNKKIKFEKIVKVYEDIINWYGVFLKTKEAKNMIKEFNKKIGLLNITDIKKIDFILWQTRK